MRVKQVAIAVLVASIAVGVVVANRFHLVVAGLESEGLQILEDQD